MATKIRDFTISSHDGRVMWTGLAADGEQAMDFMEAQTGAPFDVTKGMTIVSEDTDLVACGSIGF